MKQLRGFADSVAIVVSSCDAFFDAWQPFAFFFRKFWPDCPFPVHLITNELRVRSSFIRALPVGTDRGWASNMKSALGMIEASHILYFQEDYFLNAPVRPDVLAQDFAYAFQHEIDAFCFRARSELEPEFQSITERFGTVPRESDGRTRCQVTLWKREAFISALRDGENAWEMEARGSERTRALNILSYSTRQGAAIPYLMSAIVRGLWTREARRMCSQDNVAITSHFRGTESENALLRRLRPRLLYPFALARAKNHGPLDLDPE